MDPARCSAEPTTGDSFGCGVLERNAESIKKEGVGRERRRRGAVSFDDSNSSLGGLPLTFPTLEWTLFLAKNLAVTRSRREAREESEVAEASGARGETSRKSRLHLCD